MTSPTTTPTPHVYSSKYLLGLSLAIATPAAAIGAWYYYRRRQPTQAAETPPDKNTLQQSSAVSLKTAGNNLFKQGKFPEALDLYTKAIEVTLEQGDLKGLELLYQNRAAVWEKLGHHANVIRESSLALQINPKYVKALHRRGKSYFKTGFANEALTDITLACLLENFSSPSTVQLADEILKQVGRDEALKIKSTRETNKENVKPSVHVTTSYLKGFRGCPVGVALASQDDVPHPLYKNLTDHTTFDSIIDRATEEIATTNDNSLYYLRGTFRFLYGAPVEQVVDDFTHVIENSEDKTLKSSAMIKLASFYALQGEDPKCDELFQQCEGGCGESEAVWVDLWHHWGQVTLTRGDVPKALEFVSRASDGAAAADFAIVHATKWYIQYRLLTGAGDATGAEACTKEFENLCRRFPESPDVCSLYGQILLENALYPQALTQFSRVLQLDPRNSGAMVHRAMAHYQQTEDLPRTIELLREAAEKDDRNEFVMETLGTMYLQSGDLDNAITYISKAVDLARSVQELTILCSLRKAAEVQRQGLTAANQQQFVIGSSGDSINSSHSR